MAYQILLSLHNLTRWLVLGAMLWALFVIGRDLLRKAPWTDEDKRAGIVFTGTLGLQFLLGLAVYFVGPYFALAANDMSAVTADRVLRFFALEHPVQMLLALIIAQVGYSVSKRARSDRKKFLWAAVCYGLAALLILGSIPWPGLEYGRPLLRLPG